jgi:CubicO group peptidase (beta-lactamase class C family)
MAVETSTIDALFAEWDTAETPGCVLAVIKDGALIYQRAYGMADLERNVALTTDSIFDLGSIGKQFVAALVALLAEEGRLSLDAQVRQYIPELLDYGTPLTIRHLIHHTSGVRDYLSLMHITNRPFENQYAQDELLSLIVRQKALNFAPGEEHLYSNGGYFLLGVVAQRVGGQPLPELLRRTIFEPLDMRHTQCNDNLRRIAKNRAVGYTSDEAGGFATDMSFLGGYGDGPLLSTVGDLFLWDQNFYANRLGKGDPALIDLLQTPGILNSGERLTYAFGLYIDTYKGLPVVSHSGSWAGYVCHMARFPTERLSVICLSNLNAFEPTELALKVAELYLDGLLAEDAQKTAQAQQDQRGIDIIAEAIVGSYRSRKVGDVATLTLEEGRLTLGLYARTFTMEAASPKRLASVDSLLQVAVTALSQETITIFLRDTSELYDRLAITPVAPNELNQYAGTYTSEELDIVYNLNVEGGQVFVKRGFAPKEALAFVTRDLFTIDRQSIEFERDDAGQVVGFGLDAGRVKEIRFARSAHVS